MKKATDRDPVIFLTLPRFLSPLNDDCACDETQSFLFIKPAITTTE